MIFCIYSCCPLPDTATTDFTPYLIAFATIFITIYVVYLGKKVDLKVEKFNKLCLTPLEENFTLQERFIRTNGNHIVNSQLIHLNELNNDLVMLLSIIHQIYPKLDVNELQEITFEYMDHVFASPTQQLYEIQGDFLKTKVKILDKVYNHVLYNEVSFLFFKF